MARCRVDRTLVALFVAKRAHRIDPERTSGGQERGQCHRDDEDGDGGQVRQRIQIADAVEYAAQHPGRARRLPRLRPPARRPRGATTAAARPTGRAKGGAPSAIRIPISLVRCDTAYATSPTMPTQAITSASEPEEAGRQRGVLRGLELRRRWPSSAGPPERSLGVDRLRDPATDGSTPSGGPTSSPARPPTAASRSPATDRSRLRPNPRRDEPRAARDPTTVPCRRPPDPSGTSCPAGPRRAIGGGPATR